VRVAWLQVFALVSPERFMVLDGEPLNRREIEELRRRMFQPSPLPAFPQVYNLMLIVPACPQVYVTNKTQYMGPDSLVLNAHVGVSSLSPHAPLTSASLSACLDLMPRWTCRPPLTVGPAAGPSGAAARAA
jgi:hypothetical protein